jgi:hypothetical protein
MLLEYLAQAENVYLWVPEDEPVPPVSWVLEEDP